MLRTFLIILSLFCSTAAFAQPARVVSLKPNITDTIYALGLGARLVGVTKYCDIPDSAKKPEIVGDYMRGYVEKIAALSPDLVLASKENSDKRSIESLIRLGLRIELFSFTSITEMENSIQAIADILGEPAKGKELTTKVRREFDAITKKATGYPQKSVIIVWGVRPLVVAGPGSYMDELLKIINAENAVRNTKIKYPRINIEELIALDPDAIIDLSMGSESSNNTDRPWEKIPFLKAVTTKKIIQLDASAFRAGPNLPASLDRLANLLK